MPDPRLAKDEQPASVVLLRLPFPPKELSPNARLDWHEVAAFKASYRQECAVIARNERNRLDGLRFPLKAPVTANITFVLTTSRRRDYDNLLASFKAGLDGIVDSGLVRDDSCFELQLTLEAVIEQESCVKVWLEGAL